jgi:nucleoside-diphosphate-sugar epimerase
MNVLLTGATGSIGAQVLARLLARGDVVHVLVQPKTLSQPQKVKHLTHRDNVKIIKGSLADVRVLAQATQRIETVYHLAARLPGPGVRPQELYRTNVQGTENLLRASVKGKVCRFVFASTAAIYDTEQEQITEDTSLQPHGIYGQTKIDAENLVCQYYRQYGLEHVILRLSPVYGLGGQYFEWLSASALNRPLMSIFHGRHRVLHWVHGRDAADAVVLAGVQPEAACNIFNIAGNEAVTHQEFVEMVHRIAGTPPFRRLEEAQSHMQSTPLKYDIHKAKTLLGFAPKVSLKDGLAEMIAALGHNSIMRRRSAPLPGWSPWVGF